MHHIIRIVKMSSPNLNVLTLCGSVLAYISGFLFAVEDRSHGGASWSVLQVRLPLTCYNDSESACPEVNLPRSLVQARIWTLCLGSTLVFGPILGKTWRLYRVFTQRVPDKRVVSLHVAAAVLLSEVVVHLLVDPIRGHHRLICACPKIHC